MSSHRNTTHVMRTSHAASYHIMRYNLMSTHAETSCNTRRFVRIGALGFRTGPIQRSYPVKQRSYPVKHEVLSGETEVPSGETQKDAGNSWEIVKTWTPLWARNSQPQKRPKKGHFSRRVVYYMFPEILSTFFGRTSFPKRTQKEALF